MTAPTRRHVIAGSMAALGAAGAPAIAVAEDRDRAEWIALWLDYMRKERALEDLPRDHTEEDEEAVNEARWAAGDVICDKPATSLSGLAVKLAYAVYWDTQEAWWQDITAPGFAGSNYHGLVSSYLDAVRLAGLPDDLWRCAWVDCGPIT